MTPKGTSSLAAIVVTQLVLYLESHQRHSSIVQEEIHKSGACPRPRVTE